MRRGEEDVYVSEGTTGMPWNIDMFARDQVRVESCNVLELSFGNCCERLVNNGSMETIRKSRVGYAERSRLIERKQCLY
jgi:hypothetical protein